MVLSEPEELMSSNPSIDDEGKVAEDAKAVLKRAISHDHVGCFLPARCAPSIVRIVPNIGRLFDYRTTN